MFDWLIPRLCTHNRTNFRPPTRMHCFQLRFSYSPYSVTHLLPQPYFLLYKLYLYIILSVEKATAFTGICIYNYCTCVLRSGKPLCHCATVVGLSGCAGGLCAGFGCARWGSPLVNLFACANGCMCWYVFMCCLAIWLGVF